MARDERQVQHEICFRLASRSRGASTRVELCGRVVAVEVLGREGGECARTAELDAFEGLSRASERARGGRRDVATEAIVVDV